MTLPLIAILGARGQQGKSVLSYLSQHHSAKYAIRGIVRKPAEQAAIDGVEYVHGDYTEPDSLLKAFDGATAVFAMTNPDMLFTGLEETWGRNIADAVKQSPTVKTLIYSSVADAAKISGNTLTCSNFTGKAATQRYMEEIGVPAVFVWPAFFMQNLTGASPTAPQVDESGTTVFETLVRDDVLVPFVDIDDMGPMVHAILQDQATYLGKSVQLAGEWMTYPELAKRWTATTGKPSRSQHISYVDFAQRFGPAPSLVAEMLVDMYKFVNQFGYYGGRR
ncbi:NmrA-like family protein, partial [Powellomyces hirtus]